MIRLRRTRGNNMPKVKTEIEQLKLEANKQIADIRRLRAATAIKREKAKERIQFIKDNLASEIEGPLTREKFLVEQLRMFYATHPELHGKDDRCINFRSGRIGMRTCPRVEVPAGALADETVPLKAITVTERVNKTVLKSLGEKALEKCGAKIVRPKKFYVHPFEENGK